MRILLASTLAGLALLSGCGGSGAPQGAVVRPPGTADGTRGQILRVNRTVLHLVREHYLWPETLPSQVDPGAFRTPDDLLAHLTEQARIQRKDRRWSFIHERTEAGVPLQWHLDVHSNSDVTEGLVVTKRADGRQFVAEVLPGSTAAAQGAARGDEVVAVAPRLDSLDHPDCGVLLPLFKECLLPWSRAEAQVGDAGAGLREPRLCVRLRKRADGACQDLPLVPVRLDLDLVPQAAGPVILHRGPGRTVGYLRLRLFKTAAEPLLRAACAHLQRSGVTDLVVDLRYNSGGTVRTAELFANLLRGDQGPQQVMNWAHYQRGPDRPVHFRPEPGALRLDRIAFIVDGDSASSSENLVNVLAPYFGQDLALVGSRTHGKPVCLTPLPLPGNLELFLVTHQLFNASHAGTYFDGLPEPDFEGSSCLAEDDLDHLPGDPAEASTAAALRWILSGVPARDAFPPNPPDSPAGADPAPLGWVPGLGPPDPDLGLAPFQEVLAGLGTR